MAAMELDHLDQIAAEAFDGYIVRKDLVRKFARQYPVPTYVCEFLLGRYCASIDEDEIQEGLQIVERQLRDRAVRSGEEELFKARARENRVGQADRHHLRPGWTRRTDSYLATLPSLQLQGRAHRRPAGARQRADADGRVLRRGRPGLRRGHRPGEERPAVRHRRAAADPALQARRAGCPVRRARPASRPSEWKEFLLRSIGLEPSQLTERQRDVMLLRMVPFVENNYNMVELGPRGTGKSHLFQQISPYAHLVSGGKATVARMFVNMATGQRGLVCQYDVVCFDEVSGVSFDQKDGVNIMKGYMESGEFSRGKESIRAYGGIVMVGNFDVDVQHQQRVGHLFGPMPPEMRNDTAFMDRIHCLPARLGRAEDQRSDQDRPLRPGQRLPQRVLEPRLRSHKPGVGAAGPGDVRRGPERARPERRQQDGQRAAEAASTRRPTTPVPDEDLEWAVRLALECRRRVKEQQKRIGAAEFRNTQFSYTLGPGRRREVRRHARAAERGPASAAIRCRPGRSGRSAPAGRTRAPGLYRIEVTEGPGSGVRILNRPAPGRVRRERQVRRAEPLCPGE